MELQPDQADPKWNHSRMDCRYCIQLTIYLDGIDAIIDKKFMKIIHEILVHLAALKDGRKPDIFTLKKKRGDIF